MRGSRRVALTLGHGIAFLSALSAVALGAQTPSGPPPLAPGSSLRAPASVSPPVVALARSRLQAEPAVERPVRAVATSPLVILFGSATAEYEQRWGAHTTWGVGTQYDGKNSLFFRGARGYDLDVTWVVRYYPASRVLDGPSLGLVAGFTTYQRPGEVRPQRSDSTAPAMDDGTHTVPTIGISADVARLFGPGRHYLGAAGFGVKRRFVGRIGSDLDRTEGLRPTLRFVLGYAW